MKRKKPDPQPVTEEELDQVREHITKIEKRVGDTIPLEDVLRGVNKAADYAVLNTAPTHVREIVERDRLVRRRKAHEKHEAEREQRGEMRPQDTFNTRPNPWPKSWNIGKK